MVYCPG